MTEQTHLLPSDLQGISRLAVDATLGVTDLVEAMHHNITRLPVIPFKQSKARMGGIPGLVYRNIRGITQLVGASADGVLGWIVPLLGERSSSPEREAVLAALNGVLGDHLAATDSPLAIAMRFRRNGQPIELDPLALATADPQPGDRLVVLVHGLCMNDLQWKRQGSDCGAALGRDLGYATIYLHYNTGRHISTNGREFADLLEALVDNWPTRLDELVILGHSVGGLVARSACHYGAIAGHAWLGHLKRLVFIGTPHHGSPLERGGNWFQTSLRLSRYTAPLSRLGRIRSAGITDLRHGNLLDQDWQGSDRFDPTPDRRRPVPLPEGVLCYTMAAINARQAESLDNPLAGDGLVPINSALGRHPLPELDLAIPETRQWVGYGMNHWDLLSQPEVYDQIRDWLAG
jgi:pimeloyl-ACP methyl ester carboxylesterase